MFKMKGTKRALIASALALVMCMSMLIGSTYAWFTDSVSSTNNVITAGNLDVKLEYSKDYVNWTEVSEMESIFSDETLWEPGHTEMVYFRVSNMGSLALKYCFNLDVYLEKTGINVYGNEFKLSEFLKYGVVTQDDFDELGGREAAVAKATEAMTKSIDISGVLQELGIENGWGQLIGAVMTEKSLEPHGDAEGDDVFETALIIAMPETVGNEANYLTGTAAPYIRFGLNLVATQQTYEEDSFGDDYDEDADTSYEKAPIAQVSDDGPVEDLYVESLFGGGLFDENNNEHLRDMDATFTFTAPAGETAYDEWIADYEVSVVTPNGANLPENAVVMAGQYNFIDTDWQAFYTPEVKSGETYRLLGAFDFFLTYKDIKDIVGTFKCGVENVNAPAGTEMTVTLKLYKYAEDDTNYERAPIDEKIVGVFQYTFQ